MSRERRDYRIPRAPRPGEVIRADFLSSLRDVTNETARQVDVIRQIQPEGSGRPLAEDEDVTVEETYVEDPTLEADIIWRETSRTEDTVRVENPADPTQYVDVARMRSVTLTDGVQTMVLVFEGD